MRLCELSIKNYKSLRDVTISPADFSVFVGRNGSGKSNFADAIDFVSVAYTHGLEHAVARKGGYENIAHRKERRSRSAISFVLRLEETLPFGDLAFYLRRTAQRGELSKSVKMEFIHSFSIRAAGEGIRSEYRVVQERLVLFLTFLQPDLLGLPVSQRVELNRNSEGHLEFLGDEKSELAQLAFYLNALDKGAVSEVAISPTELAVTAPIIRPRVAVRFTSWLNRFAIFQVSPDASRHAGVPTPNPTLSARGENLPAVVDWLKSKAPKDWQAVMRAMKEILPELESIEVDYLHTRTLGLFFKESGVGRAWTAEEVSDGTIRSLAMLVACFDPRTSALVLEEPENSLHPWIIRELVSQLKKLSTQKMVMITTHSPIVLNSISPADVWVVFKEHGETKVRSLLDFDSALMKDWEEGKYRLFDYLESGAIVEAVPSGV